MCAGFQLWIVEIANDKTKAPECQLTYCFIHGKSLANKKMSKEPNNVLSNENTWWLKTNSFSYIPKCGLIAMLT